LRVPANITEFPILGRLKNEVNKSSNIIFYDNHIYVEKNCLLEVLRSAGIDTDDRTIEKTLGGEFIEGRLLNGKKIMGEYVFFRIPCTDSKIAADKLRSPYSRFRIEPV